MIYLESPVGVGYSTGNDAENDDKKTSKYNL